MAKASKALALIAQPNGSALVRIATKTATGQRLLTKWEFRTQNKLSRTEAEKQWADYVKANAEAFNVQTAALIAAGKLHITAFSATAAGTVTMKARTKLPTPEEVKPTRKEEKAMDENAAMKALGITPEMLATLKGMAPAPAPAAKVETPAVAPAAPAPGATLDVLLAEAGKEAAQPAAAAAA